MNDQKGNVIERNFKIVPKFDIPLGIAGIFEDPLHEKGTDLSTEYRQEQREQMLCFQTTVCKLSGPRHGKENRLCLVTRERMHRRFLYRVVRSRKDGTTNVLIGDGEGRSAYVSKDPEVISQLARKNKLARALRCTVSKDIAEQLKQQAEEWQRLPPSSKGLSYCEAFGADGVYAAVDEIQNPCVYGVE